jgi:hypothetical protein
MIRDYWKAGAIGELEKDLLLDCLSEEQRKALGRIHPSFMGGEYCRTTRKEKWKSPGSSLSPQQAM